MPSPDRAPDLPADLSPPTSESPDTRAEILLTLVAESDERAFAALYAGYASRVHGLVLRVVGDRVPAEDVTRVVFAEIWRTATGFDPAHSGGLGWMLAIAHRKAVDCVRSVEAAERHQTPRHELTPRGGTTTTAAPASREADRVRQSLSTMTPLQQRVIELAYFGGHTHAEVAQILGIPVGTGRTRLRAALIHLRDSPNLSPV
ncbi:MAG: sigma-70 family RNA polymerase sigma factor [Lapillicoccus sp.]